MELQKKTVANAAYETQNEKEFSHKCLIKNFQQKRMTNDPMAGSVEAIWQLE